jgi:hypothetical protein
VGVYEYSVENSDSRVWLYLFLLTCAFGFISLRAYEF